MSQPSDPQPDDQCMVCGTYRLDHGDMEHKFSTDGQLVSSKPGPEPEQKAPRLRAEDADREQLMGDLKQSIEANALMRLTEVLLEKGVIDGKDTMYIFSGFKA